MLIVLLMTGPKVIFVQRTEVESMDYSALKLYDKSMNGCWCRVLVFVNGST